MRNMEYKVVAIFTLAVLLTQFTFVISASGQETAGKLFGHVHSTEGKSIAEAIVTIVYEDNVSYISIKTDENGYFELDNLPAGRYGIEFRADGFESFADSFSLSSNENKEYVIELKSSQPSSEKKPDAVIEGYVKDAKTGSPIEGTSVSISGGLRTLETPEIYPAPPEGWGGYNSTITDENGYYEMECWSGESWVYVYSTGYRDYSTQATIEENETKRLDVDLEPKPPKTAKIWGYVVDKETGEPIAGFVGNTPDEESLRKEVWVYLNNQEESDWASVQTDENGYYGIMTYPGYCAIDVLSNDYYPYRTTIDAKENDSIILNVQLKPRPGPDCVLYGQVLDASTGKPVEEALVNAWSEETYAYGGGKTDQDGRYEIKLIHGYHSMYVWAENYFSYSTVFEINQGERHELNLVLKPGGEPLIVYPMREALAPKDWNPAPNMTGDNGSANLWHAIDQTTYVTQTPKRPIVALVIVSIAISALAIAAFTYWLRRRS